MKVVLLRERGVPISFQPPRDFGVAAYPRDSVKEGMLDYGRVYLDRDGKGLALRQPMATPGTGVMCALYQPTLVDVARESFRFRGLEAHSDQAVTLQEWLVFL